MNAVLHALADPHRRLMVERLSAGEATAGELGERVPVAQPGVSRHLAVLKAVGVLKDEKRGLQVFYSLRVPCVLNFFKCVEAVQRNECKPGKRSKGGKCP